MKADLATFPRLLLEHAHVRGERPATREKDLGIWQTWSWAQVADEVRSLACGLAALGFKRGMRLAIIGDNRPRLYWSMTAAQALGGIAVPMYQDAPAAEFAYVLNDAEIVYAVVEDQEQVDKILEAAPQVPSLKHIYYDDPRGLRNYEGVTSIDRLQEIGREFDVAHPVLQRRSGERPAGDVSIVLYVGHHRKPRASARPMPRSSSRRRAAAASTS
jgi:long-chain acyl-CoA synthetase